jgi:hypothetical protein
LLFVIMSATLSASAQDAAAEEALRHFFGATDTTFITDRGANVEHLLGIPRVVGADSCMDPPPPPGNPYALREDLNGDGAPDAAELGVRGDTLVFVACFAGERPVCEDALVGYNESFLIRPRCASAEEEVEGYRGKRLSSAGVEDRVWPSGSVAPFVRLDEGFSARYFCLTSGGLWPCVSVN